MTGRVPSADELQQAAARASRATLAWPAPADRDEAIDALEHDLSTLRALDDEPDASARGRAHYILQLNECLQRSVRERFMRAKRGWSHWDGIVAATERLKPILVGAPAGRAAVLAVGACRSTAVCPYQFLLSAIYRMRPAEDLEPLQRLDPLTRGSLFHEMQTAFYRRLQSENALPVTEANRAARPRRRSTRWSNGSRGSSTSFSRPPSIASGTTKSARSAATCVCGSTKSPAPAASGCRCASSGRSATRTAARSPSGAIRPAAGSR